MSSDSDSDVDPDVQALLLEKLDRYAETCVGKSTRKLQDKKKVDNEKSSQTKKLAKKENASKKEEKFLARRKKDMTTYDKIKNIVDGLNSNSTHAKVKESKKKGSSTGRTAINTSTTKTTTEQSESDEESDDRDEMDDDENDHFHNDDENSFHSDHNDDSFSEDELINNSDGDDITTSDHSVAKLQKHLLQIRDKLGLTDSDFVEYKNRKFDTETDKGRQISVPNSRGLKRPPPQVVVFDDPAKRKKKREEEKANKRQQNLSNRARLPKKDQEQPGFDLIQAKYEVKKFGIEGLQKKDKDQAMEDLLVQLGAKAPKAEHVNVKVHKQRKTEELERQRAMNSEELLNLPKSSSAKAQRPHTGRKHKNKHTTADGVLGRYVHGVQMLQKSDVEKIKSTKTTGRRNSKKR